MYLRATVALLQLWVQKQVSKSFNLIRRLVVVRDYQAHHRSQMPNRDDRLRSDGDGESRIGRRTLMTASLIMSETR